MAPCLRMTPAEYQRVSCAAQKPKLNSKSAAAPESEEPLREGEAQQATSAGKVAAFERAQEAMYSSTA